jgi:vitamin B12 transporter
MLPLAQIVRIEVLRGIASSLWGADAMGGVIHITTRHATREPRAGGQVTVGSLRSREADAWMTTRLGDVDLAASLSRSQSAGVSAVVAGDAFNPDRDGYARTAANVKAGWSLAPGHRLGAAFMQSRLASQYDGADYLPPTFAPDPSADFRHRARTQVASVDYRGRLSDIWTQSVQLARHDDNLRSGGGSVSRYTTQRNQFTWQHLLRPDARQQWVVAFERLGESVKADTFTANPSRVNLAGMAGLTWTQAGHTYQFDLRHDRNDAYGNSTTGRAGWRWALAPAWNVRASVGTAFRAPAFNETDYPGYGVATLQPERSTGWDAGVTWREGATSAGVTLFQNRVKQLIGYEPDATRCPADPAYSLGCAANIGRARLQGGTLTADHLWGNWSLGGTLDLLDARNLDTGERLVRRAAHQATLRAQWSQGPWASGLSLLRVGARPEGGATLDAYTTLDWFGRWRVAPGWQLEAKLTNLTDATVIPARDYQSPGRQAWLTLRYEGRGW